MRKRRVFRRASYRLDRSSRRPEGRRPAWCHPDSNRRFVPLSSCRVRMPQSEPSATPQLLVRGSRDFNPLVSGGAAGYRGQERLVHRGQGKTAAACGRQIARHAGAERAWARGLSARLQQRQLYRVVFQRAKIAVLTPSALKPTVAERGDGFNLAVMGISPLQIACGARWPDIPRRSR